MSVTVGHTAAGARKSEAVSGFNSTLGRSWGEFVILMIMEAGCSKGNIQAKCKQLLSIPPFWT